MKILITGGSGLVGSALKDMIITDECLFLTSKQCDLRDYQQTFTFFQTYCPDYVIHLACNCGGLFKNLSQKMTLFEDNILINFNVIKICHELGIKKLISCLSTCIFPDNITYPITEDMLHNGPPHFSNDGYAYSKRLLEIHTRLYREQYNDNFICIIPTNIYGKYDNFDINDAHVIPALIHKCYLAKKSNQPFIVSGSGKPLRQFIYSKDLAILILYILYNYNEKDNIILSPSDEISIGEIASIIAKEMEYEFQFDTTKADGQFRKTVSNEKLLNYLPTFQFTSLQIGIHETIQWFLENHKSFRGSFES
jgi:GDP-L-fucose synthase